MKHSLDIHRLDLTDMDMYQCGTHACDPCHAYGPVVRDHYLIHYILNGKGSFHVDGKVYPLRSGQGFLICPGIITYYEADAIHPWHYSWVGFNGLKAEAYLKMANLSVSSPIFTYDQDQFVRNCFDGMLSTKDVIQGREIRLLGYLYFFISKLIEINTVTDLNLKGEDIQASYIKNAINFMEKNFSRKFSIIEMASYIGLDRSYLGAIFKAHTGSSPQSYLINLRIQKACELMCNGDLSIGDISRSVGYDDALLFSKTFRKIKGSCPREYRKNYLQ